MKEIAIIGAGYAGLSAATTLIEQGYKVDLYDSKDTAGGLAAGIGIGQGSWDIEPFYHHWFTNEKSIMRLASAHNIRDEIRTYSPNTSFFINSKIMPFDRPHHVLMYPGLSLFDRFRLGNSLARLKLGKNWKHYEKYTAEEWLLKNMGKNVYEKMWKPMLIAKWSNYYNKVNMAWFWARIYVRTQKLMYPNKGFSNFNNKVVDSLKKKGVNFFINQKITSINQLENDSIELKLDSKKVKKYSSALVTTGPKILNKMFKNFSNSYANSLNNYKSMGAICALFIVKKSFLKNTYWLNIPSKSTNMLENDIPFLVCIDHTSMIDKSNYNGNTILYCANYIDENNDLLNMSDSKIKKLYFDGLKKINPNFDEKNVTDSIITKTNYASPVFTKNHSLRVPSFDTEIKNLFWASMSHVYPWDRGTNYAADVGFKVADHIIKRENDI
jgi:protoporphyrinogen oxidase